jgi:RimJ/RimL family protein N-acetyltransferase
VVSSVPSPSAAPLTADGERVRVRPVRPQDVASTRAAITMSADRLARWNPVDPDVVVLDLDRQSPTRRTFVVLAHDAEGAHGVVGRINVMNVVQGTFRSGTLGYDAYDPYVGRGLFGEGLRLVVGLALRPVEEGGMGLHRVEANVQPGNVRSAGVLRALGLRHEGSTPRMLHLFGPDGLRWRDHERYAVTAEEWPADAHRPHERARRVYLVHGSPGSPTGAVASAVAAELGLPLLQAGTGPDAGPGRGPQAGPDARDWLWTVLAGCPDGAVVESGHPADRDLVAAGLGRAGVDRERVVELWCALPGDPDPAPLALGPVLTVDASAAASPREVTRAALCARALASGAPDALA